MKDSGIVRKIDDLGRIVVPKELRKTLKIGIGTPIEICMVDGKIVLTKYSTSNDILEVGKQLCSSLSKMLDCGVILCDDDKIQIVSNASKKQYHNIEISSQLHKYFESKTPVILRKVDGSYMIPIYNGDKNEYTSQIVYPLINNGEVISMLVLFTTQDRLLEYGEMAICKYINFYINEVMDVE